MKQRIVRRSVPIALALAVQFVLPAPQGAAQERGSSNRGASQQAAPQSLRPQAVVRDVELAESAVLHGRVVDGAGRPVSGVAIWVRSGDAWAATVFSGEQGEFVVEKLAGGGVIQLATRGGVAVYRAWANGTAPPGASSQALVVLQPEVMRGQRPISELFFGDPVVVGLVVAAAVAIPIAVANSKKSRAPGS